MNDELYDVYAKFLKNAELRFQTGESGNIEVISAKAKIKEIETLKAQIQFDLVIYQKQLLYFIQTKEDILPESTTPLKYANPSTLNDNKVETLLSDYYTQQATVFEKEANTFKKMRAPKLGLGYFGQTLNKESIFSAGIVSR